MINKSFLSEILAYKKDYVKKCRAEVSFSEIDRIAREQTTPFSLTAAIRSPAIVSVIAEIKKGSPSEGIIRPGFFPARIGKAYEAAGAAAVSILTDERYFLGSLGDLKALRGQITLPILRKDFTVDPYQIAEARAAGADAILLIVAALTPEQLAELYSTAAEYGLQALVEVHSIDELESAMAVRPEILGINNRNLTTFTTDLSRFEQVAAAVPASDVLLIAESGIHSAADARRMVEAGANALLVGTSFMRQSSPGEALNRLIREYHKCST